MNELWGVLMIGGVVLLLSLPALIVLRFFCGELSRSLKIVLSAAVLIGNLAGFLLIGNSLLLHNRRESYRRNIDEYREALASDDTKAMELTRTWHYDPIGRPFKNINLPNGKNPLLPHQTESGKEYDPN